MDNLQRKSRKAANLRALNELALVGIIGVMWYGILFLFFSF